MPIRAFSISWCLDRRNHNFNLKRDRRTDKRTNDWMHRLENIMPINEANKFIVENENREKGRRDPGIYFSISGFLDMNFFKFCISGFHVFEPLISGSGPSATPQISLSRS